MAEPKGNRKLDTPQAMQNGAEQDGVAATGGLEGDVQLPMEEVGLASSSANKIIDNK